MPDRWSATAYTCLMVALFVAEPSNVELTVQDHVRVDRVTDAGAERYGDLVSPGTTSLHLAVGTYVFRTTQDAQVRLSDTTAVRVVTVNPANKDGPWPDPSAALIRLPSEAGDTPPERVPTLAVRT
jgi:hypothetical protein